MWAVLPDPTTMWSVVLYTLAVVVGLILFMCYEPKDEKETDIDEETAVKVSRARVCWLTHTCTL